MNPAVITPPAAYPVTLEEAKVWCRCYDDDESEDATINLIIAAMTAHAEHITGRAFVERTLELSCDYFESCIELPVPPLLGVDSISYTNTLGAAATVTVTDYEVDTSHEPGRLRPARGSYWPSVGYGFNPIRVRYRAGYASVGSPEDLTDKSYLPPQLRMWLHARIATIYDNREHLMAGTQVEIPRHFADGMLDSLIIGSRFF